MLLLTFLIKLITRVVRVRAWTLAAPKKPCLVSEVHIAKKSGQGVLLPTMVRDAITGSLGCPLPTTLVSAVVSSIELSTKLSGLCELLFRRQASTPVDSKGSSLLLGKFQLHRIHCASSLMAAVGVGCTSVSLEHLPTDQDAWQLRTFSTFPLHSTYTCLRNSWSIIFNIPSTPAFLRSVGSMRVEAGPGIDA